ncbi:hypothetical protein [Rhodococcoides corynebacterioides]|uniref:Uncharacterized protein n=1 Tax=Rhodococcoides corynebacterioides TaxID=53972 RepID=A0ABS7PAV8_9NOCA|nr:hypothetical protein [Rhodococcus corynebacterioides]MBY6368271.1 hypothetical protein [Rhodococcus corynebacterioides]MBY6409041.1 hypothetical protein [Rhodococcus corynebacterioides]
MTTPRVLLTHASEGEPVLDLATGELSYDGMGWHFPAQLEDGDVVVHAARGRRTAVVSVATVVRRPGEPAYYAGESLLTRPVPEVAFWRATGRALPTRSVILRDGDRWLGDIERLRFVAVPWPVLDASACADAARVQRAVLEDDGVANTGRCACCRRRPTIAHPHLDGAALSFVCDRCHDTLHHPFGPTVAALAAHHAPVCPRCGSRDAVEILYGMPPGPVPDDVPIGGCVVDPTGPDMACRTCGHWFRSGPVDVA